MHEGWLEPKTLVAIVSPIVSILFSLLVVLWNRRENRGAAIAKIYESLVKCGQELAQANICRRTSDELMASYGNKPDAKEAHAQINHLIGKYNEHMKESLKHFRESEAMIAAHGFRFPAKIEANVRETLATLEEFGRLVNQGLWTKADDQFSVFKTSYRKLVKYSRGWRLYNPAEPVAEWWRSRGKQQTENELISEAEMKLVLELVNVRAGPQSNNAFVVHPPQRLLDEPELLHSPNICDELKETVFLVRFQQGRSERLRFYAFLAFVQQMIELKIAWERAAKMVKAGGEELQNEVQFSFTHHFSPAALADPERAAALLEKVDFAETPA